MDILSDVLATVRGGVGGARRIRESGAWGMRYPSFAGLGFHIVLGGTGWLITRGGAPVALHPGDVVLAPAGTEHGLSHAPCALMSLPVGTMGDFPPDPGPSDFDFICGAYRLQRGQVHQSLRELPEVVALSPDYARHPELRSLVGLLDADVAGRGPGAAVTRTALLDLMIVHLLRQWREQHAGAEWPVIADPGIAAALRAIHDGPDKPWTVQQLCVIAGMSRTAFNRRFAELVGKPPMTYLIGWRLSCGAQLLRDTQAPLAAIARRVGYSTEFAFASAFRREYGLAPGRFRQDVRAAELAATAKPVRVGDPGPGGLRAGERTVGL
ncbi:AraC family transcriptional regulator [Virgisporangium aliadipatigenens]|uniref:AraC family transcriptional regulator n=1 Tax=Virgisporangium aliadipatigenens TaxID=741659 RepID=A0A8J3YMS3_9ACTN|nr:AraC family transcriptional regulator [Virgisporangium aliadipatigenens]GIJ46725.1 AraC family transcriptional regulator [Virgisporangium aliadipatigenens]